MNLGKYLVLVPYLIPIAVSVGIAIYAWRRRTVPGAIPLVGVVLSQALITLAFILKMATPGMDAKLLWDSVQWGAVFAATLAGLVLAIQYTGIKFTHPQRLYGLLGMVSVVSILLIFTDSLHGLIRSSLRLRPTGSFLVPAFDNTHPPLFSVILYHYAMSLATLIILSLYMLHARSLYRKQVGVILLGFLIPVIGTVATLLGVEVILYRDTSHFSFALGNLVIAWGLFRYGLFDILPIARDRVMENMRDGVIVMDHQNRVVDINRSAFALLPHGASEVVGRKIEEVFPVLSRSISRYQAGNPEEREILLDRQGRRCTFEIQESPLCDRLNRLSGRVIILRELTGRKQAEEALRRAHDELEKKVDERTLDLKNANQALEREIEERKQVQEALQESENRYRLLAENATDVIWTFSLETMRFTYVSPSVRNARGLTPQEAMELPLEETISNESLERVAKFLKQQLAEEAEGVVEFKRPRTVEIQQQRKDGTYVWAEATMTFLRDAEGRLVEIIGVTRDIEERKRAEKTYRELVENIRDVVFSTDEDGVFTYVSPASEAILGYRPEEMRGRHLREFLLSQDAVRLQESFMETLKGFSTEVESPILKKSGKLFWMRASSQPVWEAGRITGIHGILMDITERKMWEHQLEKKAGELEVLNSLGRQMGADLSVESVLKTALEHMSRSVDPDLSLIFLKQGEDLLLKGFESAIHDDPDKDMPVLRVGECLCGLAAKEAKAIYSRNIHADPRCTLERCKTAGLLCFAAVPLMSGGEVIGVLGIASRLDRDFEEQAPFLEALSNEVAIGLKNAMLYKKAQADAIELKTRLNQIQVAEKEKEDLTKQLYQAQKMEAIGTLAGGIAHDFNNILAPIIMGAELALMTTPVENQAHPMMQKVLSSGLRAKDLVQQILTFSRQSDAEKSILRLSPIIKETVKLARASLPATIEIRQEIDIETDLVLANPTQVHQLMMNLITNAAHAMRPKGGILEVVLKDQHLDDAAVAGIPDITAGHYVRLVAKDTGHGMDRRTMERIFNPFFTTKERGEGTGLGLSIVHGIVRSYGGAITVDSRVGAGTTFTIFLPVAKGELKETAQESAPLPRGTERLLLVDDEPVIVDIYTQMLGRLGYRVVARTDPLEALDVFRIDPESYDLVVTDMTMPKMTGDKLAVEVLRIRPDIPVILCTGFSEQMTEAKALEIGIKGFIMKPIARTEITHKIRNALDDHKAHGEKAEA